ncbi:MAG: nucleotidyl transferase AbiEii/AbiGii toxin family protein, partial [Bacteroidales bacterium]|nr:nucleotidyl transferase AbiEii/AbiGii toxin family protein [Bacteroidales bacterium]
DFEWYVRHNVPLNFAHLQERIYQFGEGLLDRETFMAKLKERLATGNIDSVKEDVQNFIIDHREMDIWSNDYFLLLADNIRFV